MLKCSIDIGGTNIKFGFLMVKKGKFSGDKNP